MGNPLFMHPGPAYCEVCTRPVDEVELDVLKRCSKHIADEAPRVEIHWNGVCKCTCGCTIPLDVQGQLICGDCACGDHAGGEAA